VTLAPKGLLIEEQRTNSIRNNTGVGAVAGTPGTLPTNWIFTGGGLAANVIGIGVEGGINYIDVQFVGTTTASSSGFRFEGNSGVTAASGQTWTSSFYIRQVGGSTSGFSSIGSSLSGIVSSGSPNAATVPLINDLGASSLSAFRPSVTVALTNVNTTAIRPQLLLTYSIGEAIDITLRIGLPQLELGAFATSVIPTTTAAATRAADVAVMQGANFSNWYRADEGTVYCRFTTPTTTGSPFSIDAGSANERLAFGMNNSNTLIRSRSIVGGVAQCDFSNTAIAFPSVNNLGFAYKVNDFAAAVNGGTVLTDASGTVPAVNVLKIGTNVDGSFPLNGHIRRLAFFPRRLANAELQGITS
jgi:hypothetical protein